FYLEIKLQLINDIKKRISHEIARL
ncbi:hypothetical protein A5845_001396, partial [Enterococcus faecium]